ncbi:MAG: hypothetical protein EOP86_13215, partial [Verrucomicrobiaceae bacterium]
MAPRTLKGQATPLWWADSGALTQDANPNDYAVAAVGQAVHMAAKARESMRKVYGAVYASGQYGLGLGIDKILDDFERELRRDTTQTLERRALRLGQLKYLSAPFWKRLQELGAAGIPAYTYPWMKPPVLSANDNALATLGQVKMAFSFPVQMRLDSTGEGNPQYQNTVYNDLPTVTTKATTSYIYEEFDRVGQSGSQGTIDIVAPTADWTVSRPGLPLVTGRLAVKNLTTPYTGTSADTPSYLRLPPAFKTSDRPAFLKLDFNLPATDDGNSSTPDRTHLYIQYRWRALPDLLDDAYGEKSASAISQRAGTLVFERDNGDVGGMIGWSRLPALSSRGGASLSHSRQAFDLAFPVTATRYTGAGTPTFFIVPDSQSETAFNVFSKVSLPGGVPVVNGPGWRTTTIHINLAPDLAPTSDEQDKNDTMDVWLDGRAMGRYFGQDLSSNNVSTPNGVPKYKSERLASPLLFGRSFNDESLILRWNGLRNTYFDIGAIFVGFSNPLFDDPDPDGIPAPPAQGQPALVYPLKPWMPWYEMTSQGGSKNNALETANSYDRYGLDPRGIDQWSDVYDNSSPIQREPFQKLDVSSFVLNLQHPEPTLFGAYGFPNGSTLSPPWSNGGVFQEVYPGHSWELEVDSEELPDSLPDNWEMFYFGHLGQTANGDPDSDRITNLNEYRAGLHPNQLTTNPDVDGDLLLNEWELKYGYNPWDGINQSQLDPDNDGLTNLQEQGSPPGTGATDPLIASNSNLRTGAPPALEFMGPSSLPAPPATTGADLDAWRPGTTGPDTDIDNDKVPDELDAVPYDGNLTFARVPESQYIVIPISGVGGPADNGVPVAINNLGHVLLSPPSPPGGWQAYPGTGDDTARAPWLWRQSPQASARVPMPLMTAPPFHSGFVTHWDHGRASNPRTLDLDLAVDSDRVLAHALWEYPEDQAPAPLKTLPSTVNAVSRIPDLRGRHAFVWDGASSVKWLPWATPAAMGGKGSIGRFLTDGLTGLAYGDCIETIAGRLYKNDGILGRGLHYDQSLTSGSNTEISKELFSVFSWVNSGTAPTLDFTMAAGSRHYMKTTTAAPDPIDRRDYDHYLNGQPGRSLLALSWERHAVVVDRMGMG